MLERKRINKELGIRTESSRLKKLKALKRKRKRKKKYHSSDDSNNSDDR